MLWTALCDPDPALIFENDTLYSTSGEIADHAGAVDIDRATVGREGAHVSLMTYGGTLPTTLRAAVALSDEGIDAEVLDLRTLRSLDDETILASVRKTHRALVVDEG